MYRGHGLGFGPRGFQDNETNSESDLNQMSWSKTIRRIAIGLAVLLVVIVIAGYFILRTAAFHRYVIAQVEQKIQQATGGRAEIASYSFDLRPLVITVNHVVVRGTEPAGALPLFQTDRIVLGLKLVS